MIMMIFRSQLDRFEFSGGLGFFVQKSVPRTPHDASVSRGIRRAGAVVPVPVTACAVTEWLVIESHTSTQSKVTRRSTKVTEVGGQRSPGAKR